MKLKNEFPPYHVLYTEEEVKRRIKQLARQIENEYKKDNPLFICVLYGSFVFASYLLTHFKEPLEIEFIQCSSYNKTKSSGNVKVTFLNTDVKNRNIIIIDDIVDTGLTLKKLKEIFLEQEAKSVTTAVLINREDRREVDFKPDYCAYNINNNFIVGFGLDYDNYGRNLPFIATLETNLRKEKN